MIVPSLLAQAPSKDAQVAALNSEMNNAMEEVRKIVNQPVRRLVRNQQMRVSTYSPGWFHEGAITPDFNNVDVRTTQELNYAKNEFVTSDLNPGVAFYGKDLEFNANTKYFYTDRSLPKKKLTEAEMVEINRLYRVVGHCKQQLAQLQTPVTTENGTAETSPGSETFANTMVARFPWLKNTSTRVACGVLVLIGVVYLFRRRSA